MASSYTASSLGWYLAPHTALSTTTTTTLTALPVNESPRFMLNVALLCGNVGFNVISLFACAWLFHKLWQLTKRLRSQLFAKQLFHLSLADAGLALANLTITGGMALIDDPVLRRHVYSVSIHVALGFLCTSMVLNTIIAVGFLSAFLRMAKATRCMSTCLIWVWPLGFAVAFVRDWWKPLLPLWAVTNLFISVVVYLVSSFRMRNRNGIMEILIWRIIRFYLAIFLVEHGVFAVATCYAVFQPSRRLPFALDSYLWLIYALNGTLNAICYAYNARLLGVTLCSCLRSRQTGGADILSVRMSILAGSLESAERNDDHCSAFSFFAVHVPRSNSQPSNELSAQSSLPTPIPSTGELLSSSVDRCRELEGSQASLDVIRERIDFRFVQELQINVFAEVLNAVVRAASEVQKGADATLCVPGAVEKAEQVRSWALESLKLRFDSRSEVSLGVGLTGIERTVVDQHADAMRCVQPLFDQLLHIRDERREHIYQDLVEVRESAQGKLRQLQKELQTISSLKEEDQNVFFDESDHLVELLAVESAFCENVLQVARANPESVTLQRAGIESLLKAMNVLKAACPDAQNRTKVACVDYARFVTEAMRCHPDDAMVQKDACLVLSILIGTSYELAEQITSLGGNELVKQAMSKHPSDAMIQVNGRLALGAATEASGGESNDVSFGMLWSR